MTRKINAGKILKVVAAIATVGLIVKGAMWLSTGSYDANSYSDVVQQEQEIVESSGIIVFHRDGCKYCASVEGDVVRLSKKYKNDTNNDVLMIETSSYGKAFKNTDENLIDKYSIVKVPSIIKIENGKVVDAYSGTDKNKIKNLFEN